MTKQTNLCSGSDVCGAACALAYGHEGAHVCDHLLRRHRERDPLPHPVITGHATVAMGTSHGTPIVPGGAG